MIQMQNAEWKMQNGTGADQHIQLFGDFWISRLKPGVCSP